MYRIDVKFAKATRKRKRKRITRYKKQMSEEESEQDTRMRSGNNRSCGSVEETWLDRKREGKSRVPDQQTGRKLLENEEYPRDAHSISITVRANIVKREASSRRGRGGEGRERDREGGKPKERTGRRLWRWRQPT